MSPDDYARLYAQLILHEGLKLTAYLDTRGYLTGGVGYNISSRGTTPISNLLKRVVTIAELRSPGLTEAEWRTVLAADVAMYEQELHRRFPVYDQLDVIRQRVLLDFVFNLGTSHAAEFTRAINATIQAMKHADDPEIQHAFFVTGAYEVMNSLWSRQVDDGLGGKFGRADRLCTMWITGQDYTK